MSQNLTLSRLAAALALALSLPFAAPAEDWPGGTPLLKPQSDGVLVLNTEAAAFVMTDKLGYHVMNRVDPRLEIEDGRFTNLGAAAQYPAWRFEVPSDQWYRVVANMNLERLEPCTLRISFIHEGKEGRLVQYLVRSPPGSGVQTVEMGRLRFGPGERMAIVIMAGARHWGRLPEIQDIRMIPETNPPAEAATWAYPKTIFAAAPTGPAPLFPTGKLHRLPTPPSSAGLPVVDLQVEPPADAAARRRAFAKRNRRAGLKELSLRLQNALQPGTPGLEAFERAAKAGRHEQALEAYRAYFFAKLRDPAAYGVDVALTSDFFQYDGLLRYLRKPDPLVVEEQLAGIVSIPLNRKRYRADLGEPGAVNWAPASLAPPEGAAYGRGPDRHPFWRTPEGQSQDAKIQLFRTLNRINNDHGYSPFGELMLSFIHTGDAAHLRRYAEYMEDWASHAVADVDKCPVNIRAAVELQILGGYLAQLRIALDERPELATLFPAPALARILLCVTETYHPYIVRAKRAQIANWGIMGAASGIGESMLLHEFRAMRYMNREFARLARINWIQHLSLDGENLESWDEGHVAIDGMFGSSGRRSLHGAPVMGPLEQQTLLDHHKVMQRTLLTHFSPDGNYWTSWLPYNDRARATILGKLLRRSLVNDIYDEPEARRRIESSLDHDTASRTPPVSDIQPYAALTYLRDGFGGDCSSLVMQNFPARSQTQGIHINGKRGHVFGSTRTEFSVARGQRGLLASSAVAVDGKPPHRWLEATPTGGKTDYSFQTPRTIQPGRFLATSRLDFAETLQNSPYTGYQFSYYADVFGLNSPAPDEVIRDVHATRQVFHLKGEGVFLVADRLRNPGPERTYTHFFLLPVYGFGQTNALDREPTFAAKLAQLKALAEDGAILLELDPAANRVRTANPGFENVSVYAAGHRYEWAGRQQRPGSYEPRASVTASNLHAQVLAAKDPARQLGESMYQRVSARWSGAGDQASIAVVATRPAAPGAAPSFEPDLQDFRDTSADGISSCSFRTPAGTQVRMAVSPDGPRTLHLDSVSAEAGALLAALDGETLVGIVVDGSELRVGQRVYRGPEGGFAFSLSRTGQFTAQPIHRPIDTTIIHPQQSVFIDTVQVRFEIPTQDTADIDFRYTLDGSDPTLESALYTGPVTLNADTLVKVRPFRKGLAVTPWNIAGVDAGKTVWAIFRKQAPLKAEAGAAKKPGLRYQYAEGPWAQLMSRSEVPSGLPALAEGEAARLLDAEQLAALRRTDRAYQVRYRGYLAVPETGVYRFHAPEPLYNTTMDAGYDLRVWVGGEEWFPTPDLHAENIWSVALEKGLHRFAVGYTDFRWKTFRDEYIMSWREEQVWQGTPVLELDGPGTPRQPIPAAWLSH